MDQSNQEGGKVGRSGKLKVGRRRKENVEDEEDVVEFKIQNRVTVQTQSFREAVYAKRQSARCVRVQVSCPRVERR